MNQTARRPLPPPPGSSGGASLPPRKTAGLPPPPTRDNSQDHAPPPLAPRGGASRPLPTLADRPESEGAYESVELNSAPEAVDDEYYDDFDSPSKQSYSPQEVYDEWEEGTRPVPGTPDDGELYEMSDPGPPPPPLPPVRRPPPPEPSPVTVEEESDGEVYDEMAEGPSVGSASKPPPLPPGRRAPVREPSPVEEIGEDDGEIYDEMTEGPVGSASKPPPLPPGRRPPAREPSPVEEYYDEFEEPTTTISSRPVPAQRAQSPEEEYLDPDEVQNEEYEDPSEHQFQPDTYELGSDNDIPSPPEISVSRSARPALPDRPVAQKKVLSPPKLDGFDPSQILQVKLKRVDRDVPKSHQMSSDKGDFRSVLRKTPGSEENRPEVKALQPPKVPLKKVPLTEKKAAISDPPSPKARVSEPGEHKIFKHPKPTKQAWQENKDSAEVPMKVLVSPPPLNMNTHPPALKQAAPLPSSVSAPPPIQTAIVKPERHVPPPPTKVLPPPPEESKQITEQDPLNSYAWFHGMINRQETEERLRAMQGDGVFLVRKSKKGSPTQPYTMVILYQGNIFNLKVRCREEDQKIALGEEKTGEMLFSSVPSLVSYHNDHNVILIGNPGGETKLLKYPKRP